MENMGIYMILNKVNNKCYIGSSTNIKKRASTHLTKLNSGNHENMILQVEFNEYGKDNFTCIILEEIQDKDILVQKENEWIIKKKSLDRDFGYNLTMLNIRSKEKRIRDENDIREKVRRTKFEIKYAGTGIVYEEWVNYNKTKRGEKRELTKIVVLDKDSGKYINTYDNINEVVDNIKGVNKDSIYEVLNKNKSHAGYIFVKANDYDPNKPYKVVRKKHERKKPLKEKVPYQKLNWTVLKIDPNTNEVVHRFNNTQEAADELNVHRHKIYLRLHGHKDTFRGYRYRYERDYKEVNLIMD